MAVVAVGAAAAVVFRAEEHLVAGDNKISKIPKWAEHFVSESDLVTISKAIDAAEQKTKGEIVPMIVRSSSTGFLAPWVGALTWLVILLFAERTAPTVFSGPDRAWILPLLFVGGMLFLRTPWARKSLHRYLTHPFDRHAQVLARAEIEFHRARLENTSEHSSVLIMASLLERDVVVLADEGVAKRVSAETWPQVIKIMVDAIKADRVADGWVQAIKRVGEILSENFPSSEHLKNEIPNEILIKE